MTHAILTGLLALGAAGSWGAGDFSSGIVARRIGPFNTVLISYSIGLLALTSTALARREPISAPPDLAWGVVGGLSGALGLVSLLRGFSVGRMGVVAPVSATVAAGLPVILAAVNEGLPGGRQLVGFGLALVSIWLLARREPLGNRPVGTGLALLAGLGFGGFFASLDQVSEGAIFWPLVAGRAGALGVLAIIAVTTRRSLRSAVPFAGLLALAGVLDVSGNLFFLLAVQAGRLDVAAVVGSLYPAITAILARVISSERLVRLQGVGIVLALIAISLITI